MSIELLTPKAERAAVGVVKQAIELHNSDEGLTPSQALIKAAEGCDFSPDMLCRLAEAFNSSAQIAHFENSDAEKRAEAIPLASHVEVVNAFYPEKVESNEEKAAAVAVPTFYDTPERDNFMSVPSLEKSARAEPIVLSPKPRAYSEDPGLVFARNEGAKRAAYRRAEILQTEAQHHIDKVAGCADQLIEYFRGMDSTPFAEVEKRAGLNFVGIADLMGHVFTKGNLAKTGEKRAAADGTTIAFIDKDIAPYSIIKAALHHVRELNLALNEAVDITNAADAQHKEATTKAAIFSPLSAVNLLEGNKEDEKKKKPDNLYGAVDKIPGALGNTFQPGDPYEPSQRHVIEDPEHGARLASIEQQAILNDLMTNDPVIGAVDPQEVLKAFNRLSAMAPFAARDPNVLRSVMRRYVQQQDIDPFELKQIIDLNEVIRKRDEPLETERMVLG